METMPSKLPKGCDNCIDAEIDPGRTIKVVPKQNRQMLTEKQLLDYYTYRERFLRWLLSVGRRPEKAQGYSPYTVYESGYRAAAFDRWVWDEHEKYRLPPEPEDADSYLEQVAYSDRAQSSKGKIEEMLKRYFRWLSQQYGTDEWEPPFTFESGGNSAPRDFLTTDERRQIREAALNHGSIPSYNSVSPEERKQWKGYVAQVLDKPIEAVTPDEWDEVDGWKITSLVWASLDAGLRPVEVGRAKTTWVDTTNGVLRIPREEASKNAENWVVSLTGQTASSLDRWLDERERYSRYDGTAALWLTTHGNPYGSKSLGRLLRRLCDEAGIPTANRQMSWYAIRHSVGTYMTAERDLAATKAQLRHKSVKTTMKYDAVPVEERRDALNKIN